MARDRELLAVPDDLALVAMYRLGYLAARAAAARDRLDQRHRKRLGQYVFRDAATPERDPEDR